VSEKQLEQACDAAVEALRTLRRIGAFLLTDSEVERLRVAQDVAETLPFVDR
jgi:predicted RNA-binding Zn ribbon-like protein